MSCTQTLTHMGITKKKQQQIIYFSSGFYGKVVCPRPQTRIIGSDSEDFSDRLSFDSVKCLKHVLKSPFLSYLCAVDEICVQCSSFNGRENT